MAEDHRFLTRYRNGIRTSLRNNAGAYGFSVVATADFATISHLNQPPDLLEIFFFIFGAVAAFALLEAITSRMFREKLRGEPSDVVAMGTAFSFVSISSAVGVAAVTAWLVGGMAAWPLAAFGSTACYLLVLGIEMALAERVKAHRKDAQ